MSKRQYIINLDMMLGVYYGMPTGYHGLKLEDLETLSYTELDLLMEELEISLEEVEEEEELMHYYYYYF